MIGLFARTIVRSRSFWSVVAALAVIEASLVTNDTRLSTDIRQLRSSEEVVARLDSASGFRVLVLGNSMVREGLADLGGALFERGLTCIDAALLYPDDTSVLEWYHIYKRFVSPGWEESGLVVIGFARDQLRDQTIQFEEIHRLSQWYEVSRVPDLIREHQLGLPSAIDLFLASASRSYSMRQRLQRRILDAAIPHYRSTARLINENRSNEQGSPPRGTDYLEKLLEEADVDKTRLAFVAFPLPNGYAIDTDIEGLIAEYGQQLLDMRQTDGIHATSFMDGFHMTTNGAETFTRALAARLSGDLLPPSICSGSAP